VKQHHDDREVQGRKRGQSRTFYRALSCFSAPDADAAGPRPTSSLQAKS